MERRTFQREDEGGKRVGIASLPWGEMIASGGLTGAAVKALEIISNRGKSKAYTMGAVDHAVQTAMSTVTDQLDRTEERLKVVEGQHHACEVSLREVNARLDEAKREIGRLMSEPAAHYPGERP